MMVMRRAALALSISGAMMVSSSLPAQERPGAPKAQANVEKRARASRPALELVNKASEELLDLKRKVRALEAEALEHRHAAEERLKDLAAEKRSLGRSLEGLKQQVPQRERELSTKKEALNAREREAARVHHEVSSFSEPLKQFLDRVDKLVEGGIPWKTESRRTAIREVKEAVSAPGSSPAASLAAIGRLQEEEEALGLTVELGTVELDLGTERWAVQAFHLGLLAAIFSSEDGTVVGCALPGQKLEEGARGLRGNREAARGYLLALDVLRRRRSPRLVDLHIPSLPGESEEAK